MKVKELKQEGLSHELEITIPANDIDARVDQHLQKVGNTVRIPGFRPGKVPLNILKQRFGKNVMGEVLESTVNETSQQALKDKGLKAALQPKIEVKEFDEGKDLTYTLAIEVVPEFKTMDLKSLKLERLSAKPDDEALQNALEGLAAQNAGTQPVKTKRGAKDGDTLVIGFKGRTADDNKEHDGMASEQHQLTLGSGQFIPGFEEQLVGAKAESQVEVKVTFPENYGAKELAGRDAIFDVDVKEILEPAEAKVDDEFAKNFGLDNLDALKEAIGGQLEQELNNQSRLVLKKHLLDILDEKHVFDVPEGMLDMEFQNIMDQVRLSRRQAGDMEEPELDKDEEKELKDIANRRVRLGLVLSEIGNANNIKVADPELQQAVVAEAQKYRGQEQQVFEYYSKNPQALESLRAPLFEEKTVDFILELAEISDKEVTPAELNNALDDDLEQGKEAKKKPAAKKKAAPKKKAAAKKDDAKAEDKPAAKKKAPAKKAPAKKKTAAKKA